MFVLSLTASVRGSESFDGDRVPRMQGGDFSTARPSLSTATIVK
jgi:hypothetical protein